MDANRIHTIFHALMAAYGPQQWWPAETPFEVMVGAVLTQNTAWTNVESALIRLRARVTLAPEAILSLDASDLADALRPSGYFNVKARRLSALCRHCLAAGGVEGLARLDTHVLRRDLLTINGVGPETADDILLYAFDRPVFVVDAYTRRLFKRLGLIGGDEDYEWIRSACEQAIGPDVRLFKEYHALIVHQGKMVCRIRPNCHDCSLRASCPNHLT